MVSLTCISEGGALATKGPRPEKFIFEAGRLVGGILKEFVFLRPRGEVEKANSALRSFSRGGLLQGQKISHLNWCGLAPTSNVV